MEKLRNENIDLLFSLLPLFCFFLSLLATGGHEGKTFRNWTLFPPHHEIDRDQGGPMEGSLGWHLPQGYGSREGIMEESGVLQGLFHLTRANTVR